MADFPERDMEKIAKGWSIAMLYSKERLKRVHAWEGDELEQAIREGRLVLETVCLFIHACVKRGQYRYGMRCRLFHDDYIWSIG